MNLTCFRHSGWTPLLRPAPSTRAWMDATPEQFAYRCLPLNIANAHGWEVLNPFTFDTYWTGGTREEDVIIRHADPEHGGMGGVSMFGQGTITFHTSGIFRTDPGWNLWVTGSPNSFKDGIQPLSAVVETDWSPYPFTMSWRFTRRNHTVRFEKDEPICFIFPVPRDVLPYIKPVIRDISSDPDLESQYNRWSASRSAFSENVKRNPPAKPADKWQKKYFRGLDEHGIGQADHTLKLRLNPFVIE